MAKKQFAFATYFGLILALIVPLLPLVFGADYRGVVPTEPQIVKGLALHWLNLLALLALVLFWERRGLASIGIRPLRGSTLAVGLLAGIAITVVSGLLVNALHLKTDTQFAQDLMSFPLGLRVALVITAGLFEETVFRGYGIERLTGLLRNRWLAAAITCGVFVAGHAPAVGWASLLPIAVVSVCITLLYLWKRDLILNMIAHSTVDGIALLLTPLLTHGG